MRPRPNRRHFADDIFKCILLNENVWIPIKISLKFVPQGPINNIPTLVQIMAWRRPGDKPLSEPMMVKLPTHICVTRPQWVKPYQLKDTWWSICTSWSLVVIWASYQIRRIAGCACAGMPGTFSPSPRDSDPDMHHGTCVTHVPWCMPGSLTSGKTQPAILRIW